MNNLLSNDISEEVLLEACNVLYKKYKHLIGSVNTLRIGACLDSTEYYMINASIIG